MSSVTAQMEMALDLTETFINYVKFLSGQQPGAIHRRLGYRLKRRFRRDSKQSFGRDLST